MSHHTLHPPHSKAPTPHAMHKRPDDRPELGEESEDRVNILDRNEVQTFQQVLQLIQSRHNQIAAVLSTIIGEVQRDLFALEGLSFGLDENKKMASEIQGLLNRLGVDVRCLGCHEPAKIRCGKAGASKTGAFQFDHAPGGRRTFHCGSRALPHLTLVSPTPDQRLTKKQARNRVSS
jgi:hypothetical protein